MKKNINIITKNISIIEAMNILEKSKTGPVGLEDGSNQNSTEKSVVPKSKSATWGMFTN